MTQKGVWIVAAALTAFVLVVAGGIIGRLSRREPQVGQSAPAKTVVAARATQMPRPAVRGWRDDDDHDRLGAREHEREDDDD